MKIKQRIQKTLKNPEFLSQILLLAALLASCCIMFRSYLFGEDLMVFDDIGSDTWQQYIMHYASIINHIRSGNFSFWDFTNGFGTSFFSLNLFDPTLIFLYAVGCIFGHARMLLFINWMQVLRILAAGWIFYRFLMKFSFSRQARFAAAYIYGLNGYLLVWGQHYQFGIVTIYLPLLLLFAEKFLRREKGGMLFPAAVCLCAMDSVYFSYMTLIGVGFYLLFRIWMEDGWKLKERVKRFLTGCVQILLGVAMSAAAFLPTVNVLLNVSSRISEEGKGIVNWLKTLFSFYGKHYYNILQMRLFSSHLENADFSMDGKLFLNYYEAPVLFCCTLTVFLGVQFLAVFWRSEASRRCKAAVYTAVSMMILCVLMPWGGSMFNAFVMPTNRYTFVLTPFLLLAAVWMWDFLKNGGKICWIGLAAVEVFLLWVVSVGYRYSELNVYRKNAIVLAVTGTVMALCIAFLSKVSKTNIRRLIVGLLGAAIAVNMMSEGSVGYKARVNLRKLDTPAEEMAEKSKEYQELADQYGERQVRELMDRPQDFFRELYLSDMQEILEYLKETEPEFCRVEKDYSAGTRAMDSLLQGYRGISTYNSVMNKNISEFVDTCYPEMHYPNEDHYVFWKNADDNWFASFTGIRYLISRNPDLDSSKYRFVKKFTNLYLYENVLETDMARFYDTAISENSLKELCTAETRQELLDSAIAVDGGEDIQEVSDLRKQEKSSAELGSSSVTLDNTENDSRITGSIQAAEDGYVLFMIPFEKGWSLKLNGEKTELFRGDLGFLACQAEKGNYEIELTFHPPLLREGIIVSILFWMIYVIWVILQYRKKDTGKSEAAMQKQF